MPVEHLPSAAPELAGNGALQSVGGWILAAAMAVGGWVFRLAVGRYFKAADEQAAAQTEAMQKLAEAVGDIGERLARIEGRFEQQDHGR